MKIKLLKNWNGFSPGRIIDPTMNQVATDLIRRGIAEMVTEPPMLEGAKAEKRKPKLQEWVRVEEE